MSGSLMRRTPHRTDSAGTNTVTMTACGLSGAIQREERRKIMKRRKWLSILLAASMGCALLAGCGSSEEDTSGDTASTAAETEGETSSVYFDETQEIQMYTLTMYDDDGLDDVEAAINEISEAEINVHINIEALDISAYMEQVGLMLAGGEAFDLVMCTSIPVVSFSTMQSQNELMDITEYLEVYAPETAELMSDYIGATTVDGSVYAVPCYRIYNSNCYLMMRTDILDELGLTEQAESITSWSEYEAILEEVYENMDSLPEDMQISYVMTIADAEGTVITNAYADVATDDFSGNYGFDLLNTTGRIYIDEETDTVGSYYATDDYKTSIDRVYEWAQSGYIYADAATADDGADTGMASGACFSYVSQSEYGVEAVKEAATGFDLTVVEFAEIPIQTSNGSAWAWAVPTTSENPEAAVAFMELMYTNADIENLFVYGIEGKDYELNEEGEACILEDGEYQSSDFFYGNQFLAYPAEGTGSNFREEALAQMEEAEISPYYGFTVNTDEISNELTAISTVVTKYKPGLEAGSLSSEEYLQTMLDELDDAGLQTVIDYYQTALDEWLAEQ